MKVGFHEKTWLLDMSWINLLVNYPILTVNCLFYGIIIISAIIIIIIIIIIFIIIIKAFFKVVVQTHNVPNKNQL